MKRPFRTRGYPVDFPGTLCRASMSRPVRTKRALCVDRGMTHTITSFYVKFFGPNGTFHHSPARSAGFRMG
jgi:hypothetical protein